MTLAPQQYKDVIVPPDLSRKFLDATDKLIPRYKRLLENVSALNAENAAIICDYIAALQVEINASDHHRRDIIDLLTRLAKHQSNINFKDLTRENIIAFLDSSEYVQSPIKQILQMALCSSYGAKSKAQA